MTRPLLPRMLAAIKAEELDVVVGSRYVAGGGVGEWDRRRVAMSGIATRLARLVISADLTDPMSGFFMMTRPAFERAVRRLSGQGFKILLDLFASTPVAYRFKELPYIFRPRLHGESKLDSLVVWEYLMLLLDKLVGRFVPVRFVSFAAIGGSGVVVHFTTLCLALKLVRLPGGAGAGDLGRHDQQLRPEQPPDLSRPASDAADASSPACCRSMPCAPRRGRQCRHRLGGVRRSVHLVGRRPRRRRRRRRVELRRLLGLHLAPQVILAPWGRK